MKNLKFFFIFLFLLSCGYSPIYQTEQNSNFKFDKITFEGDKKIGRSIIRGIERLKNNQSTNVYNVNLITSKRDSIATKDKKGNVSTYKLIIEVDINLKNKNNDKTFSNNAYPSPSKSFGGFSNVWGGTVFEPKKREIETYKTLEIDIKRYCI